MVLNTWQDRRPLPIEGPELGFKAQAVAQPHSNVRAFLRNHVSRHRPEGGVYPFNFKPPYSDT